MAEKVALIETPKYSFRKYEWDGSHFKVALKSPFPTLFNYGIIEGTVSGDGMPQDVLVLGERLRQGERVLFKDVGTVRFTDSGEKDDKVIGSRDGEITVFDLLKIRFFFTVYSVYKRRVSDRNGDTRFHGAVVYR